MNTEELVTLVQLQQGATVFKAVYLADRRPDTVQYSFKNCLGVELQKDDFAVVETNVGFKLVQVAQPDVDMTEVGCDLAKLAHLVAAVDQTAYKRVRAAEAKAHKQLSLSEATARLDVYRQQLGTGTFEQVAGLLGSAAYESDAVQVVEAPAAPPTDLELYEALQRAALQEKTKREHQ